MAKQPPRQPSRLKSVVRITLIIVGGILLLLLAVIVIAGLLPIRVDMPIESNPVTQYEDAVAKITAIQTKENETPDFNPVCESILMTHGQKTEHTIVFYHGFTSCPEQYRALGEEFYDLGYNVYIPLAPYHGLRDRYGQALNNLTAEDLVGYATETADIAQGLGERVTVSGLSGGGPIAAWLGQARTDIDLAAPMAPFIGIKLIPGVFLNRSFTNLLPVIPNIYRWWDPITRENNPASAPYSYVGYPFRSMGTYMKLGFATLNKAGSTPPGASSTLVVLNANETSISNAVGTRLADEWRRHTGTGENLYMLQQDLNLPHDFISTTRPGLSTDQVYPILISLLTDRENQ